MSTEITAMVLPMLTPLQRAVEILVRRDGMGFDEIAAMLDMTPNQVARAFTDAEVILIAAHEVVLKKAS